MTKYWLDRTQVWNGYINDKCLRALGDGRWTWLAGKLRSGLWRWTTSTTLLHVGILTARNSYSFMIYRCRQACSFIQRIMCWKSFEFSGADVAPCGWCSTVSAPGLTSFCKQKQPLRRLCPLPPSVCSYSSTLQLRTGLAIVFHAATSFLGYKLVFLALHSIMHVVSIFLPSCQNRIIWFIVEKYMWISSWVVLWFLSGILSLTLSLHYPKWEKICNFIQGNSVFHWVTCQWRIPCHWLSQNSGVRREVGERD